MLPVRLPSYQCSNMIDAYKVPSKSSLKKIKVELKLKNQPDGYYRPGDTIEGDLLIFKTDAISKINDVWFNDIELKFQNITISHPIVEAKKKAFVNFSMTDSPDLTSSKLDENYELQDSSFPFKFVIPRKHFDNNCENYLIQHENLIPSFGSPQLCGIAFGAENVAGMEPVTSESFKRFQNIPFNKFSNFYSITAEVSQKSNSHKDPYVVFKRSMEIKVTNDFEVMPTNLDESSFDVGSYYNISDTDSSNELSIIKTIGFKNSDDLQIGTIMCSSLLPSAMVESSTTSFPIDLKYTPIDSNKLLPDVKASIQLNQYVIQSQDCLPPIANPVDLPKTHKVTGITPGRRRVLIQKIQTVYENSSFDFNKQYAEWVPDYNDDSAYISQLTIAIPSLQKDEVFRPTFHSCHLQNIYILKVDLLLSEHVDEEDCPKKRSGSWGELVGLKKSGVTGDKMKTLNKNTISISVPIIVT